jgi:hypothetical protein
LPEVPPSIGLRTGGQAPPEPSAALGRIATPPVYPGAPLPEAPPVVTNIAHGPEAPPVEVLKARGLAAGGQTPPQPQASSLGTVPVRTPVAVPPPNDELPFAGRFDQEPAPMAAPKKAGPVPGSKEDLAETKAIQEQSREIGDREDRARLSQIKSDWFARNAPGKTKAELTGTARAPSNPLAGKRMDYFEGGAKPSGKSAPPAGTRIPAPDEDLVPILKKSLKAAKEKQGD